jgi:hypothetical protein
MWGSPIELERRNRIKLAVAAYSYEFENHSIMSDGEFDEFAKLIDPHMSTGNHIMDLFFQQEFQPDTGQWIHRHPELDKIKQLYLRFYKK